MGRLAPRALAPGLLVLVASLLALPAWSSESEPGPHGSIKIKVPHDVPAYVVPGAEGEGGEQARRQALVYLPGRCGDPFAGVRSWPDASRKHGTLVVVQGDAACPGSGRRRWSSDASKIQARIDAAVEAVSATVEGGLDRTRMTLIGYSEGAHRAELLARSFPERYPRVLLIGSPKAPSPSSLTGARAIVTMVGERDTQKLMREGTEALEKAGRPVRLFVLPRAGHGQYGPEGSRVMDEALGWAFSTGRERLSGLASVLRASSCKELTDEARRIPRHPHRSPCEIAS